MGSNSVLEIYSFCLLRDTWRRIKSIQTATTRDADSTQHWPQLIPFETFTGWLAINSKKKSQSERLKTKSSASQITNPLNFCTKGISFRKKSIGGIFGQLSYESWKPLSGGRNRERLFSFQSSASTVSWRFHFLLSTVVHQLRSAFLIHVSRLADRSRLIGFFICTLSSKCNDLVVRSVNF